MSRFSKIAGGLGTIVRKPIAFRDKIIEVGFRALSDLQLDGCEERAANWVLKNGGTPDEAKEGNGRYDRALYAETLKLALVDADSPDSKPEPFIDCSVAEFRDTTDPEMIAYLYATWQLVQDEISPRPLSVNFVDFVQVVTEAAKINDPKAVVKYIYALRQAAQQSCILTLVCLLFSALQLNSPSSSEPEQKVTH